MGRTLPREPPAAGSAAPDGSAGALAGRLPLLRSTATAVLSMLFQPVVDLETDEVVGYEALARGPVGSPWEQPQELFAQAREEGRLREMDWACRVAAVRDVRACAPTAAWRLFLNTEAEVLGSTCPEELLADWVGGADELSVVVEVTERALAHGPRRLLRAVDELRDLGCEIALDDVGSNEASVALLPLVEPDVVKLDAGLLRAGDGTLPRHALRAVERYVARSGAVVLAEGIETPADRACAVSVGARWGQGFLFARPQVLPPAAGPARTGARPAPRRHACGVLDHDDAPRLLVSAAELQERLAGVVAAAVQDAPTNVLLMRLPDPALAPEAFPDRLASLQHELALSQVTLGAGPVAPDEDVVAVLLGPSVAHAVLARPTADGRFDLTVSEDGELVAGLARELLTRSQ